MFLQLIILLTESLVPSMECFEILTKRFKILLEAQQKSVEGIYALAASTHTLANRMKIIFLL